MSTTLSKEQFYLPLDREGLAYAGITQIYREGILTTMYAQGYLKGEQGLGDPFHVGLSNTENLDEKTLEENFYVLVNEKLHQVFTTKKSLPSK